MIAGMTAIGVITIPVGYILLAVVIAAAAFGLFKWLQRHSRGETTSSAAVRRHREAEQARQRAERAQPERRRR